jgi:hypothetical protein
MPLLGDLEMQDLTTSRNSHSSYVTNNESLEVSVSRKLIYDQKTKVNEYECRVNLFQELDKTKIFKDKKLTYKINKTYQDFLLLNEKVTEHGQYQRLVIRGLPSILEFNTVTDRNHYQSFLKIVDTLEQYLKVLSCDRKIL